MFRSKDNEGWVPAVDGVFRRTLVYGDKTMLTEFKLLKGHVLPTHKHPHEQTGYLVSGKIILYIGDDHYETNPGDCWMIPGDVNHYADILEDSLAVEVFAPPREDYR